MKTNAPKDRSGKAVVAKGKKTTIIKSCYSHLGGKFGNALAARLVEIGWIRHDSRGKDFVLTKKGEKEFQKIGMDISKL